MQYYDKKQKSKNEQTSVANNTCSHLQRDTRAQIILHPASAHMES